MFTEKVERGIALLDERTTDAERFGEGYSWREDVKVNSDRLGMTDPFACILGIVYGEFWRACRELSGVDASSEGYFSEMHEWAADHGFVVADEDLANADETDDADDGLVWDELDAEWRRQLDMI